mmetsp:Transcript_84453/g.149429  ORF Transcript_84453/g.149429 Transcript_84453/m.149429 type:complete len:216 (-) Transcript_84453:1398-2045(-)
MRLLTRAGAERSSTSSSVIHICLGLLLRLFRPLPQRKHLALAERCLCFEVTAKLVLSFTNAFQLLRQWTDLLGLLRVVLVPGNQFSFTSNLELFTSLALSSNVTSELILDFQRCSQLGLQRVSHSHHGGQLLISSLDSTGCFRLLVEPGCLESVSLRLFAHEFTTKSCSLSGNSMQLSLNSATGVCKPLCQHAHSLALLLTLIPKRAHFTGKFFL